MLGCALFLRKSSCFCLQVQIAVKIFRYFQIAQEQETTESSMRNEA